jgi:hypothetical protein
MMARIRSRLARQLALNATATPADCFILGYSTSWHPRLGLARRSISQPPKVG